MCVTTAQIVAITQLPMQYIVIILFDHMERGRIESSTPLMNVMF